MQRYFLAFFLLLPLAVSAQTVDPRQSLQTAASGTGLRTDKDPVEIIVDVINILLYFLGSIFLVLILWAGFKWMTAAGNNDAIKKSRDTIVNSVIGLIIIFASYAIVNFVLENLVDVAGSGGGGIPATVSN